MRDFWSAEAAPGEDGWAVGTRHAADDNSDERLAAGCCRRIDGRVAGVTATGRVVAPEPVEAVPPMLRPVVTLKNRAEGTEWIHFLAVYPDFRRRGVARRLLERRSAAPAMPRSA